MIGKRWTYIRDYRARCGLLLHIWQAWNGLEYVTRIGTRATLLRTCPRCGEGDCHFQDYTDRLAPGGER